MHRSRAWRFRSTAETSFHLALFLAVCCLATRVAAPAGEGTAEKEIRLRDVNGALHAPLSETDKKATVLFFLLPDCPISNAYAPEIRRICADYSAKKVAAFVVHADPDVSPEQAKKHAKEYGLAVPVLLDPTHAVVRKTGATKAPEAVVVGPRGVLLYRGRIDDWYVDYGKRRVEPTRRDLRDALDAVLKGKAVRLPWPPALGCDLPEMKH